MKLSEYFEPQERGTQTRLALQIGAHNSDLSDWINGKRPVPIHRCAAIEEATERAVSRRDLRPDDWHLIWPELAAPKPAASAMEAA